LTLDRFRGDKEYLAFIAALAARNHLHTLLHGESLLKNESFQTDNPLISYVLGGTELAAFALGEMEKVAELEKQYSKNADSNPTRLFLVQAAKNRMGGDIK